MNGLLPKGPSSSLKPKIYWDEGQHMMRKTMTPPALLVAAALGLTACGGDNPGEAAEAGEVNTNESIE